MTKAAKTPAFGLRGAEEHPEKAGEEVSRADELKALRELIQTQARQLQALQELEAATKRAHDSTNTRPASKERFRIVIDDSADEGEPPEVFVGYQGTGNLIKRGWEVDVAAELLEILNNAVETRFIMTKDSRGMPTGLRARNVRRFPYQMKGMSFDADGKQLMADAVYVSTGGDTSEVVRNS